MAGLPTNPSNLDLSISMPGFSTGTSFVRDLDINQVPTRGGVGEEECVDDDDDTNAGAGGGPPWKKLRLTKEQSRLLEESFQQNHTLNPKQKETLAMKLMVKPRQVEVWFQNRRARSKLKQTEIECEYLKRWFGSLTEQNKLLRKEVEELRALRVAPPPNSCEPMSAGTLSMCPRCERVTATTTAANASSDINRTLSDKAQMFPTRHPSAAC
ncbi:homeobox-leucine zipper protein HOX3-like [Impatiens glandulifera]|uniref:homeobox-leucine zipper protein HOX3-like n=1 Tax=Impatiens glandulifera TaxID=253017 RepID=UPI001FB12C5B|nr:homeobox-leucine zipper protein HOX3-like [Impatiens glandulifera]